MAHYWGLKWRKIQACLFLWGEEKSRNLLQKLFLPSKIPNFSWSFYRFMHQATNCITIHGLQTTSTVTSLLLCFIFKGRKPPYWCKAWTSWILQRRSWTCYLRSMLSWLVHHWFFSVQTVYTGRYKKHMPRSMVRPHVVVASVLVIESQKNCQGQIITYGWEGEKK